MDDSDIPLPLNRKATQKIEKYIFLPWSSYLLILPLTAVNFSI